MFANMRILLAGRLSQTQAALNALITSHGGSVVKGTTLDEHTSLVVVKDASSSHTYLDDARTYNVPVVLETYLHDCVAQGAKLVGGCVIVVAAHP
jgi:hypothetical protein